MAGTSGPLGSGADGAARRPALTGPADQRDDGLDPVLAPARVPFGVRQTDVVLVHPWRREELPQTDGFFFT